MSLPPETMRIYYHQIEDKIIKNMKISLVISTKLTLWSNTILIATEWYRKLYLI